MSAVDQIKKDYQRLNDRLAALVTERESLDNRIRTVRNQMVELEGTLKVLSRYEDAQLPLGEPDTKPVTVDAAMAFALSAVPGGRVAELIAAAENFYGQKFNPKSAGNALWRLKKDGHARREGQNWWPAEPKKKASTRREVEA